MIRTIVALVVLASATALAAKRSADQKLVVLSQQGDRSVRYEILKSSTDVQAKVFVDEVLLRERPLKATDWQFLVREFAALPDVNKVPNECYRANIRVALGEMKNAKGPKTKASCLGIQTIHEPKFVRFVNLLSGL